MTEDGIGRRDHRPSAEDPEFCRVCCLPILPENDRCVPYPGNPERPFLSRRAMESLVRQERFPPADPLCSAPPDDDPAPLHILAYINDLTIAKDRSAASGWRLRLAKEIAKRLSRERKERIARQWRLESCQTLYAEGIAVETPFSKTFIVGRYIAGAAVSPDRRTVEIRIADGRKTKLRPSPWSAQFAEAVNRYAGAVPNS